MELSVKGYGREMKVDASFYTGRKSFLDNKGPSVKNSIFNSLEKTQSNLPSGPITKETLLQSRLSRKFTKDDLETPRAFSLRKPQLIPDVSFRSHKTYVAISTPKPVNFSEIEAKLDERHQALCKSQISSLNYKTLSARKIMDWGREKSLRSELTAKKFITPSKGFNYSPGSPEDYHSDEEDFSYSFASEVGKVRKKFHKLIDVSRHPDYVGAGNYMSMQPYLKYAVNERRPQVDKYSAIKEAQCLKATFARKNLRCRIEDFAGNLIDLPHNLLPRGGEGLLKK